MNLKMLFAAALAAAISASPATAQSKNGQMNHSSMMGMKMSKADMNMMMSCKRMSKSAMRKNSRCSNMMKMHPDMMNMSMSDMKKMSSCMKMSSRAMMSDKRCASMMKMHHNKKMDRM